MALGLPSEETIYALNQFKIDAPRVIETAANETDTVALVDHNEAQQSVSDIKDVEVYAVVDHHRIANFETANPLYYRAEPVGCTNTILYKMFQEKNIAIPADIAGLMLSAIISDTLLFKSPTCTPEDEAAAAALTEIAGVSLQEYGLAMLKAGTNLDDKSIAELLTLDAKSFPMGAKNVRIAQVNTVDVQDVLNRKDELVAAMETENAVQGYDVFLLVVTNIIDSDSALLAVGSHLDTVASAFGVSLIDNVALLPGVVSRKKQVVPPLTEAFSK